MALDPPPEDDGPDQGWLASYADAMTLLLAFFIMMFAFAIIDEDKFNDFKVGVAATFGIPDPATDNTNSILSQGSGVMPDISPTAPATARDNELIQELEDTGLVTPENAEALRDLLERQFDAVGAAEVVEVGIDERGVFIRFDGHVLFPSGEANLDDEGLALLTIAAQALDVVDNMIEVEGHTDNRPTGTLWPSNWELSGARAARVVRWLIEPGGIPDVQLRAIGYSDTRPRDTNDTVDGRQNNRRVEIVILVGGMEASDVPLIDPFEGTGVDLGGADGGSENTADGSRRLTTRSRPTSNRIREVGPWPTTTKKKRNPAAVRRR